MILKQRHIYRNVRDRIIYNIKIMENNDPIKVGKMVNNLWYVHSMEYYTVIRKERGRVKYTNK